MLRDLHLKLFRRYYDVFIPVSANGEGIHLWNGGRCPSASDMVSAQPFTRSCPGMQWEFVSDEEPETLDRKIEKGWRDFFLNAGQPDEKERLAEVDALIAEKERADG